MRRFFMYQPDYDVVTEDQIMEMADFEFNAGNIELLPDTVEEAMGLLMDTERFQFGEDEIPNTNVMKDGIFVENEPLGCTNILFD